MSRASSSARLPQSDLDALRGLLVERGFLEARDGHHVMDRAGRPLPWIYYGGQIALTHRGAALMASVVLDRLRSFSSTQLATYGVSAIPLLATCIAQAEGRYSGVVIRREPKAYSAGRQIDGDIDPARTVVVIDESIASGRSIYAAIAALEAHGLVVEGAICIVEFTGYGAVPWLRARGYRIETIFDVWKDLGRRPPRREHAAHDEDVPWSTQRVPSGSSPARVARRVAETFRMTGCVLAPPVVLDRTYEPSGGAFVSVRRRSDDVRIARGGVWHLDRPSRDLGRDVVVATYRALRGLGPDVLDRLDEVKFAAALLGTRIPIDASAIDHEQRALMVQGRGPLDRFGFALPNAPHYDDEIEQLRYARTVTARFSATEPYRLYQQSVLRVVEEGESWPPYGAPSTHEDADAFVAALRARVSHALRGEDPVAAERTRLPPLGEPIVGVGVSLYREGLLACALSTSSDPDAALDEASRAARAEALASGAGATDISSATALVTVLLHRRELGRLRVARLPLFVRLGRDALEARAGKQRALLLPHHAVHEDLGVAHYARRTLASSGMRAGDASWTAYETRAWLVRARGIAQVDRGYPRRTAFDPRGTPQHVALAREIARFVLAQWLPAGVLAYAVRPTDGHAVERGPHARVVLALSGLLEVAPALEQDTRTAVRSVVEALFSHLESNTLGLDRTQTDARDAQALLCLSRLRDRAQRVHVVRELVSRLLRTVHEDGVVAQVARSRIASELDALSGVVLTALIRTSSWLTDATPELDLLTILAFYRRRFGLSHPWPMVWGHAQAWSAAADRLPGAREFAFELVDFALRHQSRASGAFVIDGVEPNRSSFVTACVLEGVAAASCVADRTGDTQRASRYRVAWERGIAFLERLVIRPADAYFSSAPSRIVGGVRRDLTSSELRIDYAGHVLRALGLGLRARRMLADDAGETALI